MGTLNEYINKAVVIGKLQEIKRRNVRGNKILCADEEQIIRFIEAMPAADVRPVVRGKWEQEEIFGVNGNAAEFQSAFCSVCRRYHTTPFSYYFTRYNFCPNCGAVMIEDNTP